MTNTLLKSIYSYLDCTREMCLLLQMTFNVNDLLAARRANAIPAQGNIEGVYYSFHGVGCYFENNVGSIDIDFGANGILGFDRYRLKEYLKHMASSQQLVYINLLNEETFMSILQN